MVITISKSNNKNKKFMVEINGKLIHFGQAGASDYTIHHDDERKQRYLKRHMKNEKWDDPTTAGFWSKNLLWSKKTIAESIADINKRFRLNVELK